MIVRVLLYCGMISITVFVAHKDERDGSPLCDELWVQCVCDIYDQDLSIFRPVDLVALFFFFFLNEPPPPEISPLPHPAPLPISGGGCRTRGGPATDRHALADGGGPAQAGRPFPATARAGAGGRTARTGRPARRVGRRIG